MSASDNEPAIQDLIRALAGRYGAGVFPVDNWRMDTAGAVSFTSAQERRISVSVVTLGQLPDHYSVMVEVYREGNADFPFDIAVDREGVRLPELLELFAHFLDVRTLTSPGGSDYHTFKS